MKLLSKNDVDQKKAIEYRQSREEGLKLARRVDALRQTHAQEEQSLEVFRRETLAKIHEETKIAQEKRDALTSECQTLENARKNALKPITEELEALKKAKDTLQKQKEAQEVERATLTQRESTIKASENSASLELFKAIEERRRATELLQQTDFFNGETRIRLAETESIRDQVKRMREEVEKELLERDVAIASKERTLATWQKNLEERENELNIGIRKLADRQATLERSIKRLKK